jgi:hypothetical protein
MSDGVLRRVVRWADGWIPLFSSKPRSGRPASSAISKAVGANASLTPEEAIDKLRRAAEEAGRDPTRIGIEVWMAIEPRASINQWIDEVAAWSGIGVTHLTATTNRQGLTSIQEHIDLLQRFHDSVGGTVQRSTFGRATVSKE